MAFIATDTVAVLRIVGIYHALRVACRPLFILTLVIEVDKFGHVGVRLSQMKRLWLLTLFISTASLRFKQIFFRRVEVTWIVRLRASFMCNRYVKRLCSCLCF